MFAVHSLEGWLINMSNPYKTRAGGATVTVFVPYDCNNHCPFCINKQEYEDCTGFSLEAILRSIRTMDEITPACDFVFTGGEPLVRPTLAAAVMTLAHQKGLHTAIETCGWFDLDAPENRTALRHCDLLIFDLKHLDSRQHRAFTHMDNSRILENLDRIVREFPALPLWVRTPVVRGFNDNEADIRDMARHVAQLPTVTRHELLPCLPVGEEKYAQLGMVRSQLVNVGPDSAQLQELRAVVAACRREARHGRAEGEA